MMAEHGFDGGAGMQVGGDPNMIGVSARWDSLADYQDTIEKSMADEAVIKAMMDNASLFGDIEDTISKSYMPAGEPDAFTTINEIRLNLAAVADGMNFVAESAAAVSSILDRPIGVLGAVTGDRSRVLYVSSSPDMADMEASLDKLESHDDYIAMFKKSEGLVVPNSLTTTLWRTVSA